MSPQIKVGLVIIAGLVAMAVVILTLGDVTLEGGNEYYVLFDSVADLPARAPVKIAGVDVGRVNKIELYKGRARLKVWITDDVTVYRNAEARIIRSGLIGNTFLSIDPGAPEYPILEEGAVIEGTNPLAYEELIDELMSGLKDVTKFLRNLDVEDNLGRDISQTFSNLRETSESIKETFVSNGDKLDMAIQNLGEVTSKLNNIIDSESETVSESLRNIRLASEDLKVILERVSRGEGIAGQLTSEETGEKVEETIDSIYRASEDLKQAINRFKGFDTEVDAGVYYEPDNEIYRTYAGVKFETSSRRYLKVALENINEDGDDLDAGGDRINALTLKAGKRFGNFGVFGGAIRSSGGFGADWTWRNRLNLETEIFRFTKEKPRWNFTTRFKMIKFLNIGVSYEDIFNEGSLRTGLEVKID